jgi:putative glutathione S-transferase
MGQLVDGVWHSEWIDASRTGGVFVRPDSAFRDQVSADGSSGFAAEAGRYHLYVSLACPWAHRTLILRALKGLEQVISVSVVHPLMHDQGWNFGAPVDHLSQGAALPHGSTPDHLYGLAHLWQIYVKADPHYSGKVTVPVLWDKHTARIVNNESPEILRMLNSAFDALAARPLPDLYPPALQSRIEQWNERIYRTVNNGVYRAGFATRQDAYEQAVRELFDTLDVLEEHLSRQRYLCGDVITEADWRLFPTLVRFDTVYHGHFKCNLRRLIEYPNLWAYTRELYQWPGVADTVNHQQNRQHYYGSHAKLNPTGIVALGPELDWHQPHLREEI